MNEQDLQALQARDAEAFARLFDGYADKIYRLACGILEDEVEADCVVQDVFLRLFERLDQFDGRSQIGTWVYRIAYNASVDRLRKNRPTIALSFEDDVEEPVMPAILADWRQAPETALSAAEIAAALDEAIAGLSPTLRAIFILREIEGFSTAETAAVSSLSQSAVKVRLHRARLALREDLSKRFVSHAL